MTIFFSLYIPFLIIKTHHFLHFFFNKIEEPPLPTFPISLFNYTLCFPLLFKLAIIEQESASPKTKLHHQPMAKTGPTDEDFNNWPPWLKPLLRLKFFVQCKTHPDSHKNECNMYCLTCMNAALCSLCLQNHKNHPFIQIRRSSYNDVVRISEIPKQCDIISGIQPYTINGAKVVFLNERPQSRLGKGVTYTCQVCERGLVEKYLYCSLGCKIVGTSKNIQKKNKRKSFGSESEDSYSTNSTTTREEVMNNNNNVVQSSTPTLPQTSLSFRSAKRRRKGVPQRAPLS